MPAGAGVPWESDGACPRASPSQHVPDPCRPLQTPGKAMDSDTTAHRLAEAGQRAGQSSYSGFPSWLSLRLGNGFLLLPAPAVLAPAYLCGHGDPNIKCKALPQGRHCHELPSKRIHQNLLFITYRTAHPSPADLSQRNHQRTASCWQRPSPSPVGFSPGERHSPQEAGIWKSSHALCSCEKPQSLLGPGVRLGAPDSSQMPTKTGRGGDTPGSHHVDTLPTHADVLRDVTLHPDVAENQGRWVRGARAGNSKK